jgi:hypothetical protein
MQFYISDLAIQMGITQPDGMYRLLRDAGKAFGQDPDQYITEPTPGAIKQRIFAEEAFNLIVAGLFPEGVPAEQGGYEAHMQKLIEIMQSPQHEFGLLSSAQVEVFRAYMQDVSVRVGEERRQAQMIEAARNFQGGGGGGGGGGTPGPQGQPQIDTGQPPISGGAELLDETLPGAGGGGAVQ